MALLWQYGCMGFIVIQFHSFMILFISVVLIDVRTSIERVAIDLPRLVVL